MAGSSAEQTASQQMLEGPELSMVWLEILYRGSQPGDRWEQAQIVYLEPHSFAASLHSFEQQDHAATEEHLPDLQDRLRVAVGTDRPCLLLVPVQGPEPKHWTALTYLREAGSKDFTVQYFDSAYAVHANCRSKAQAVFRFLRFLEVPSQPDFPPTQQPVWQGDGWSCGWQTLNRFEELYRQFRGEGKKRVYTQADQRRVQVNRLAAATKEACSPAAAKAASSAAPAASAASAAPLAPPPAPPPVSEPLLQPAGLPKAAVPSGSYGCRRCKYAKSGWLSCCPEKMLRYAYKKD